MIKIPLLSRGMCGFDTETTGTNPQVDQIVTASVVFIHPDEQNVNSRTWLINCERESCEEAVATHGITNDRKARDGVPSDEAIPAIARALRTMIRRGVPVVTYNAPFDLTILDAELSRLGKPPLFDGVEFPVVIDPLVIDKAMDKWRRGSRKLVDTARLLGVELGEDAHDATSDALAACGVAAELFRLHSSIGGISGPTLMRQQEDWYREQQEGYERWRRQNGDLTFRTSKSWPVREVADYAH